MNDADSMNTSTYRRAFRYLKSSVSQASRGAAFSARSNGDTDLAAVETASNHALDLVFFPSYARKSSPSDDQLIVNVHGWVFSPASSSKPTRRNRYTMVLARSLAGLPALPSVPSAPNMPLNTPSSRPSTASTKVSDVSALSRTNTSITDSEVSDHHEHFDMSDLSNPSTPGFCTTSRMNSFPFTNDNTTELYSGSSSMKRQESTESFTPNVSRHYSDHDLVSCHANLVSRIAPFLSKPVTDRWVKCDIVANGKTITSSKLLTGENGHFRGTIKIASSHLDVNQLNSLKASIQDEQFSGTTEIHFIRDSGVSVISDMDDTVKHTNILAGMREAFRNAFVRDLPTLQINGVRSWYESMKSMGCDIHYVSNAPYQLWPCLAGFIKIAGLPSGSIHLKQYSGFLQGMFEPAAEKKRANVERILQDFPDRRFLLIGDSGEQDLELYVDLARSEYAKQILAIFIRDVSSSGSAVATPTGESGEDFFSAGKGDNIIDSGSGPTTLAPVVEIASPPPKLPARPKGPLIDLSSMSGEAKDEASSTSNKAHWADMIDLACPAGQSSPPLPKVSAARTVPIESSSRPTLPRKPTALKFWTKDSAHEEEQSKAESIKSATSSRVTMARTKSSGSLKNGVLQSPLPLNTIRRPNMLRSLSANSTLYGESRRLTKAQERTHAWEVRLAKARASLPKRIKLYTWKEGSDCQHYAEELIRKAFP